MTSARCCSPCSVRIRPLPLVRVNSSTPRSAGISQQTPSSSSLGGASSTNQPGVSNNNANSQGPGSSMSTPKPPHFGSYYQQHPSVSTPLSSSISTPFTGGRGNSGNASVLMAGNGIGTGGTSAATGGGPSAKINNYIHISNVSALMHVRSLAAKCLENNIPCVVHLTTGDLFLFTLSSSSDAQGEKCDKSKLKDLLSISEDIFNIVGFRSFSLSQLATFEDQTSFEESNSPVASQFYPSPLFLQKIFLVSIKNWINR